MNEQKHKRHEAREAFQESLERLQQVLDLAEEKAAEPNELNRLPTHASKMSPPQIPGESTLDLWEDAVNDIDRFLESDL